VKKKVKAKSKKKTKIIPKKGKKTVKPSKKPLKKGKSKIPAAYRKVLPVKKGDPLGKCEGCGCVIKLGDNYGRWDDDVITCATCSPLKHKHIKFHKGDKKTNKKPSWLKNIIKSSPTMQAMQENAKKLPPVIIKPAGQVKLVRFKRESDTEYANRVGDYKKEIRTTKKGRRLSNKEIAYLMLHNALRAYPVIAHVNEMTHAAGYYLRQTRVAKIRSILAKRTAKMLKPVNALLLKRGIIKEDTHAEAKQANESSSGEGNGDTVLKSDAAS